MDCYMRAPAKAAFQYSMPVQAFCWLCGHATGYMHTWSEIANHSCGRYKEEADKRIDQAQRNNKRYQHYCLRW